MSRKSLLIVGASSFIGDRLFNEAKGKGYQVTGTYNTTPKEDLAQLDIRNANELSVLLERVRPTHIIWVAGQKSLNLLEESPNIGFEVNVEPIQKLISALISIKISPKVTLFSSDYVFDGTTGPYKTTDTPNPHTVYGKSKMDAENYLAANWQNYCILRTSAVMGKNGGFFDFLIHSLKSDENSVEFFEDLYFSPTPVDFLCSQTLKITDSEFTGVHHVCGDQVLSRFDFSKMVAETIGSKTKLLPVKAKKDILFRPKMCLKPSVTTSDINWPHFFLKEVSSD